MKVARIAPMRSSWETFNSCNGSIWKPNSCGCTLMNYFLSVQCDCQLWRRGWNCLLFSIKIRQGSSYSVFISAPLCSQLFSFIVLELNFKWWHIRKICQTWLIRDRVCKEFQSNPKTHQPSTGNKEKKEKYWDLFSVPFVVYGVRFGSQMSNLFQLKREW